MISSLGAFWTDAHEPDKNSPFKGPPCLRSAPSSALKQGREETSRKEEMLRDTQALSSQSALVQPGDHLPGGDLEALELSWVRFIPESPFSKDTSYAN